MVIEPSSNSSVLVKTHEYQAVGYLMWPYMVRVFWICYALLMMRVGVQVSSNIWVSLVFIVGIV